MRKTVVNTVVNIALVSLGVMMGWVLAFFTGVGDEREPSQPPFPAVTTTTHSPMDDAGSFEEETRWVCLNQAGPDSRACELVKQYDEEARRQGLCHVANGTYEKCPKPRGRNTP